MNFNRLIFRDDIRYSQTHEWARLTDDGVGDVTVVTVGIDDFSQTALGDIVFLELPEVGMRIEAGKNFGSLESTKAVSDLIAPVSGRIVRVNAAVVEKPELVNQDPYGEGWLVEIKPEDLETCKAELAALMDCEEYKKSVINE